MTEEQRAKRNLDPHKAARVAMLLYAHEYAKFGRGSMDFWDSIGPSSRWICRKSVEDIEAARCETADEKSDRL